jgi:NAD(P)-dependent dehydrogenase (short-subunit alcohol dehydrogenase family)
VVGLTEVLARELEAENSKVGVSVLCPGTVHTNIGRSSRNRPAHLTDVGFQDIDIELEDNPAYRWIGPDEAGAVVVRAIKNGYLYALTHPDWYDRVAKRHQAIAEAFRVQAEAGPPIPRLASAGMPAGAGSPGKRPQCSWSHQSQSLALLVTKAY